MNKVHQLYADNLMVYISANRWCTSLIYLRFNVCYVEVVILLAHSLSVWATSTFPMLILYTFSWKVCSYRTQTHAVVFAHSLNSLYENRKNYMKLRVAYGDVYLSVNIHLSNKIN